MSSVVVLSNLIMDNLWVKTEIIYVETCGRMVSVLALWFRRPGFDSLSRQARCAHTVSPGQAVLFWKYYVFSVDLFFIFFLPRQLVLAVSRQIYTKFGRKVSSCMWLKQTRAILISSKTRSQRPKKHRKSHVFARCDETVTVFFIFSAITSRMLLFRKCHIVTVQNRSILSITWHNGASKRPPLTAISLENSMSYGQS